MKTTLGVALTPPTAAALIAGACVLAAAFLPSCHSPGTTQSAPMQVLAPDADANRYPQAGADAARPAPLRRAPGKPLTVQPADPSAPAPVDSGHGQR